MLKFLFLLLFRFSSAARIQVLFGSEPGVYLDSSVSGASILDSSTTVLATNVYTLPPDAFPTRSSSGASPISATPTPLVMSYYPDWSSFPPESIDFNRFDWIDFAFAVPKQDLSIEWDDKHAPNVLKRLVGAAHSAGKKVKLSIGGWSGSGQFSNAVAKPENRQTLANNLLAVYNQYQIDGIDIDWEYPGQVGHSGNKATPTDSLNFLAFLQLLNKVLPENATLTAAVQSVPFAGADGKPLRNVSAFAEVLDWIMLMNYDVWGCTSFSFNYTEIYFIIISVHQPGTKRSS